MFYAWVWNHYSFSNSFAYFSEISIAEADVIYMVRWSFCATVVQKSWWRWCHYRCGWSPCLPSASASLRWWACSTPCEWPRTVHTPMCLAGFEDLCVWRLSCFFFNFSFDGRVVAKLPFVPLSYIQGLSHRNLLGEDYTDCSFIFLYILCTMSIRQVALDIPDSWALFTLQGNGGKVWPFSSPARKFTNEHV